MNKLIDKINQMQVSLGNRQNQRKQPTPEIQFKKYFYYLLCIDTDLDGKNN